MKVIYLQDMKLKQGKFAPDKVFICNFKNIIMFTVHHKDITSSISS